MDEKSVANPLDVRPSGEVYAEQGPTDASAVRVSGALAQTAAWLLAQQNEAGDWCGELQGDTILESEYILLLAWLGRSNSDVARKAARYILSQQLPSGGWALYPGGPLDISCSVKAYFALKLTDHDPQSADLQRARAAIRAAGGADAVNSFTRFFLALLGQIPYQCCPAVPPEIVLLPDAAPVSIYRISAWSRTILVPLSIMWAFRPVRRLESRYGIGELLLADPRHWPPLRCPGRETAGSRLSWERLFRGLDWWQKQCERLRIVPLRRTAIRAAEKWMIDRFEASDGLGAIFPPIVWSAVALHCLGYQEDSPELQYCHQQLQALMIHEGEAAEATVRLQPCKSPVWDTALTLRALAMAPSVEADRAVHRATLWLLSKQVARPGDWSRQVKAKPGGWFFEYRNPFYPDLDDTVMVMMALRDHCPEDGEEPSTRSFQPAADPRAGYSAGMSSLRQRIATACEHARRWVLAMQNRDGGWGAFDKDNDQEFLCHVPFADHNAMIDPSTPDITGRVLEALACWGMTLEDPPLQRAVHYLRRTQEGDGSWFGRWGVNYIYGTWQALVGLRRAGVGVDDPAVVQGAQWLLGYQQPGGGWGESPESYALPNRRGQGPATASQTAWAVMGLVAAGLASHPSVARGVDYLLQQQGSDGTWDEPEFTGTGFPRVFYLRYHLYPVYFPMLALGQWSAATAPPGDRTPSSLRPPTWVSRSHRCAPSRPT